jgi:hypothetical protein
MKYKKCHLRDDMHKRVEAGLSAQYAARSQGGAMPPPRAGKKGKNRPPEATPPPV